MKKVTSQYNNILLSNSVVLKMTCTPTYYTQFWNNNCGTQIFLDSYFAEVLTQNQQQNTILEQTLMEKKLIHMRDKN